MTLLTTGCGWMFSLAFRAWVSDGLYFVSYSIVVSYLSFLFLVLKDYLVHSKRRSEYVLICVSQIVLSHVCTISLSVAFKFELDVWYARFLGEVVSYCLVLLVWLGF